MNRIFLIYFKLKTKHFIANLVCTTGIFKGGDMVQHWWRNLWRRVLALFIYTRCRAGKRSKRFNRSTRTARKTSQIASVLRRTMDHNRRSDIRRKWASCISFSTNGDFFFLRFTLLFRCYSAKKKTICRVLLRFPADFFEHLAYWPTYW